jgi:hypothetical protein
VREFGKDISNKVSNTNFIESSIDERLRSKERIDGQSSLLLSKVTPKQNKDIFSVKDGLKTSSRNLK